MKEPVARPKALLTDTAGSSRPSNQTGQSDRQRSEEDRCADGGRQGDTTAAHLLYGTVSEKFAVNAFSVPRHDAVGLRRRRVPARKTSGGVRKPCNTDRCIRHVAYILLRELGFHSGNVTKEFVYILPIVTAKSQDPGVHSLQKQISKRTKNLTSHPAGDARLGRAGVQDPRIVRTKHSTTDASDRRNGRGSLGVSAGRRPGTTRARDPRHDVYSTVCSASVHTANGRRGGHANAD